MGGRPPKPNEYHELTKPKLYGVVKARVENTPKAQKPLKPRCPSFLGKDARKEWNAIAKVLKNYNLFVSANQDYLNLLAVNRVFYKECLEVVLERGFDSPEGKKSWGALNTIEKKMIACLKELGLSSMGLAKIGATTAAALKNKSKMEQLLY